jgi:simple sugar transport system permease protein
MSGTPMLFTALGELLGEKAGVLNVGLEGIMLVGGATGYVVTCVTRDANLGLLAGACGGLLFELR